MITLSDDATSVLTRSYTYYVRVQSWLGDTLLSDDVPVIDGGEEVDRSLRVPERATLTVPRTDRGVSWDPVEADAPLAAFGQRLTVTLGIGFGPEDVEWMQRGEYLVTASRPSGDTVQVEAAGLLQLIDEARLASPYQPSGTLVSTLRGLVEPALTVDISASLTDRNVPSGINVDEDRLGAVLELLDAWPADASVTADGYLSVAPAVDSATSVLSLTDGTGGTVLRWEGESTRDGACTCVVARGTASDGGQVQGVAYDLDGISPLRYGGPFSPLPVPYFYSSPLLTTTSQCQAAATTTLARLRRHTARKLTASIVPHPGLQAGDAVTATGRGLTNQLCIVEALHLPYTPSGAETLTLRVVD